MIKNNIPIRKDVLLLLGIFLLILNFHPIHAAGLAVNKAVIDYEGVLKGGYAEDVIFVYSDTDFDVPLTYETMGYVKDWISFNPDINKTNATIFASRDHIQALKIIIQPPADIPTGNYTGAVRILTGTFNKPEGPYGSQLQAAFLIRINIEITGRETISCNVGGVNIPDTEIGKPLEYYMTISNDGNVRVSPNVSIDFWNQDQSKLVISQYSDFGLTEVLPTTATALSDKFENNLRIGQYWAYVVVAPCNKSQLISFSIVEKGAIADIGELVRIENKPWANIGEIIPITAFFRNTGQRIVSAKFKGAITSNNELVENLDSDYYDIAPSELFNITVFFTPKKLGQYYITGRILYNNKLSFEKSSILNVNGGVESPEFNWLYVLILIVIIIIFLILLIKIKKKKSVKKF